MTYSIELETFVSELMNLTEPIHILKQSISKIEALANIAVNLVDDERKRHYNDHFKTLERYCINSRTRIGRAFASKHGKKLASICGDGSLIYEKSNLSKLMDYASRIEPERSSTQVKLLSDYSPWLASYRARSGDGILVEIPGQFNQVRGPIRIEDLVKISGFSPSILVMSSLRMPKKLTFIGSDENEYHFLVKGGEDLRLDQRVQQMFTIMNSILTSNSVCQKLKTSIKTYTVVPLSTKLGIIEWLPDTKPLRGCMGEDPAFVVDYKRATEIFTMELNNIKTNIKSKDTCSAYWEMFKMKPESVKRHLEKLWGSMKQPYLRKFYVGLAAFPESFIRLRAEFSKSLAALSISSYLLGIGDRHAENFLIELRSGRIIGIDFGHAFGSATEVLPVPELVPFRLTRQIELLLSPLGSAVLLQGAMVKIMTAFRENQHRLLTFLNIFVTEPLCEWKRFEQSSKIKILDSQNEPEYMDGGINPGDWYPQEKISIIKQKLEGINPCYLTAKEMELGHAEKPLFSEARLVLMGVPGRKRYETLRICPTVQDQVECLLDQATDPSILGRAYVGWAPWC